MTYRNRAGLCDRHSSILATVAASYADEGAASERGLLLALQSTLAELRTACARDCGA